MVHRRTRVQRTYFNKLPNGAVYYKSSDNTGPFVKTGFRTILTRDALPQEQESPTEIADVRIGVVRVDPFFTHSG